MSRCALPLPLCALCSSLASWTRSARTARSAHASSAVRRTVILYGVWCGLGVRADSVWRVCICPGPVGCGSAGGVVPEVARGRAAYCARVHARPFLNSGDELKSRTPRTKCAAPCDTCAPRTRHATLTRRRRTRTRDGRHATDGGRIAHAAQAREAQPALAARQPLGERLDGRHGPCRRAAQRGKQHARERLRLQLLLLLVGRHLLGRGGGRGGRSRR